MEEPLLPERERERRHVPRSLFFGWLNNALDASCGVEHCLPELPAELEPESCREVLNDGDIHIEASWFALVRRAYKSVSGRQWAWLVAQRVILDMSSVSSPIILQRIIDNPDSLTWGAVLVVTFLLRAFVESQHLFTRGVVKLRIQAGLQSSLFSKAVCSEADDQRNGQVQNLIAIDCDRASGLLLGLLDLGSMGFQLVAVLFLLFVSLSWTCVVAIALILFLLPLNHGIMVAIARASKALLAAKDSRSAVLDMMTSAIRYIKAADLEDWVGEKIQVERRKEMRALKTIKLADAVCVFLWGWLSVGLVAVTLTAYWQSGRELKADVIFPVLALFQLILLPLNALPWVLNGIVESIVSQRRIDTFLSRSAENGTPQLVSRPEDPAVLFEFRDVMLCRADLKLTLPKISVRHGELIAISGDVGKSSVLHAFLRSTRLRWVSGSAAMARDMTHAYVGQQPYVYPTTARENILFGCRYDHHRYEKVVRATRLENFDDVRILNGEHACSGGEAARISISRALYSSHKVLLIDDVLGSLDAKTRRTVVNALVEEVHNEGRTVVIVTREVTLMSCAHAVLRIKGGVVVQERNRVSSDSLQRVAESEGDESEEEAEDTRGDVRREHVRDLGGHKGSVKVGDYGFYFRQQTLWFIVTLVSLVAMQATRNSSDLLLAFNLRADGHPDASSFMPTYLILVAACSAATMVRAFSFAFGGLRAASRIHEQVIACVIGWPFAVHASTITAGELSNRLVVDVATVDDSLPFIINIALAQIFGLGGIIATLLISVGREAPVLFSAFLALAVWYRHVQRRYIACSREVKRLEASRRSPMHTLVLSATSSTGRDHIKAYRRETFFSNKFDDALEAYLETLYVSTGLASWLALRLQLMASVVAVAIVGLSYVVGRSSSSSASSLLGLAIAYILPLTGLLGGLVSSTSEVEREMVSVERLRGLLEWISPTEVRVEISSPAVAFGDLRLEHVHVQYPGSDRVAIRDVTLEIASGQHVVVVGKSGSGKSTLASAILGLLPLAHGTISVGGMNVAGISVKRAIGYLPQAPVLFDATVRENLDPRRHHSDEELSLALRVTGMGLDLDAFLRPKELTAASKVFFSLARLFLLHPHVLLLDEPSSMLNEGELRQLADVISEFSIDRPPITILETSHSLGRALRADLVVVLREGAVVEVGTPCDLKTRASEFASMLNADSHHDSPLVTTNRRSKE